MVHRAEYYFLCSLSLGCRARLGRDTFRPDQLYRNDCRVIDNQVKDTFHGNNKLIAPLSLTIFVWVFDEPDGLNTRRCGARAHDVGWC